MKGHLAGEKDWGLKGHIQANGPLDHLAQLGVHLGHAPRERPHPVDNGALEPEELGGQSGEVNRVVVTRDGRVTTAGVCGDTPEDRASRTRIFSSERRRQRHDAAIGARSPVGLQDRTVQRR